MESSMWISRHEASTVTRASRPCAHRRHGRDARVTLSVLAVLLLASSHALAVGTSHWTHTNEADFKNGTMTNVVATNLGDEADARRQHVRGDGSERPTVRDQARRLARPRARHG